MNFCLTVGGQINIYAVLQITSIRKLTTVYEYTPFPISNAGFAKFGFQFLHRFECSTPNYIGDPTFMMNVNYEIDGRESDYFEYFPLKSNLTLMHVFFFGIIL